MKRFNLIYILLVTFSLISFSFTIDNSKTKQEDPKKTKQEDPKKGKEDPKKGKEDPKKAKPEDSKKTKEELQKSKTEEALKSKTEDLKKSKSDTIKKVKVVTEELEGDSIIVYKGFKPYKKKAHASYYHDKFNGKRTASGKKYDKNKFTAAHKKLPFGSKVKVTNESNGKSVVVEVTDRGPFTKGREIDLSRKAFMAISGGSGSGSVNVTLEVLQE